MKPKTLLVDSDVITTDRIIPIAPLAACNSNTVYSSCVGFVCDNDTIEKRVNGVLTDKAIYLPNLREGYEYDIVKDDEGEQCLVVIERLNP